MALDQQRNWVVAMAENLRRSKAKATTKEGPAFFDLPILNKPPVRPLYLPDEILVLILDQLQGEQLALAACCRLSRQWYEAAVPYLYEKPQLYGKGFTSFTNTICPSINLHVRKSPLATLVKNLDMSRLVHQGSKSTTARLLGRTKNNIEVFRAPQASFAINCLPALAKCVHLRYLDLSLVSESPSLVSLCNSIQHLDNLHDLHLPRSTPHDAGEAVKIHWPHQLRNLTLSGGIDRHALQSEYPASLKQLTIEHCPHITGKLLCYSLEKYVRPLPNLENIVVAHMPRLGFADLDDLLWILPQIKRVSVSIDNITPGFLSGGSMDPVQLPDVDADGFPLLTSRPAFRHEHLRTLLITSSGSLNPVDKIWPGDVLNALDDEMLPALRLVHVPRNMMWTSGRQEEDHDILNAELQARNQKDYEERSGIFADLSAERLKSIDPDASSGLRTYDG